MKAFASEGDLAPKEITFSQLSESAWAYTAQGDPNTGVIVGDDSVMVIDTQATPAMAQDVIARIQAITDKPIRYVTLTHYHAVRVLGASAYKADHVIASEDTRNLIVERGQQDYMSEHKRFPRLFREVESIPGLTWPNVVFQKSMKLWMGKTEIHIMQLGRGHTKGDSVVWVPDERVLFSGDLVEYGATPYTGDAYLEEWPRTLDAVARLKPLALVPGRGDALTTPENIMASIQGTRDFLCRLYRSVRLARAAGKPLEAAYRETYDSLKADFGHWVIFDHCLPFDVSRAYDEASGIREPRIWTAERDEEMWRSLEGA